MPQIALRRACRAAEHNDRKDFIMKINGTPKSSALFYWTDASSENGKRYYASFFTISPVAIDPQELPAHEGSGANFGFPIMVHEPLPCSDIERVISDARERNAAIVDCGRTTARTIRTRMKRALGDYLQAYMAHFLEIRSKQDDMASRNVVDLDLENIRKKIRKPSVQDRNRRILEALEALRAAVKGKAPQEEIDSLAASMMKLDDSEEGFAEIVEAASSKGKIPDRIAELFAAKVEASANGASFDHGDELASLLVLFRLDVLRDSMRKKLGRASAAISVAEDIFKIKYLNPSFCGGDDLNRFCNILTEKGAVPGRIARMYIDKYFAVISRNFDEAARLRSAIESAEKSYFDSRDGEK